MPSHTVFIASLQAIKIMFTLSVNVKVVLSLLSKKKEKRTSQYTTLCLPNQASGRQVTSLEALPGTEQRVWLQGAGGWRDTGGMDDGWGWRGRMMGGDRRALLGCSWGGRCPRCSAWCSFWEGHSVSWLAATGFLLHGTEERPKMNRRLSACARVYVRRIVSRQRLFCTWSSLALLISSRTKR